MSAQLHSNRFVTSKEELAKLGQEFKSEVLPLLEMFYNTTFWILLNKKETKKIVKQIFFEAIENCDITKANADWNSWISRIWMREILDFYSKKENDIRTVFDFIDRTEVNLSNIKTFFSTPLLQRELIKSLGNLPAILRIPMIMKELTLFNYEKISELIDVPYGVIATRIFRGRKLLYLFLRGNYDYEEQKSIGSQKSKSELIFDLRQCSLFVDDELTQEQKDQFQLSINGNEDFKAEILIQSGIKKILHLKPINTLSINQIKAKIEKKEYKKFQEN